MAGPIVMSKGPKTEEAVSQTYFETGGVNVGNAERIASVLVGGAIAAFSFTRESWLAKILGGIVGTELVIRGVSGHCAVYQQLGVDTASATENQSKYPPLTRGINVVRSIVIDKSPEECYRLFSDIEDLPRYMRHLESVRVTGPRSSHWVAKAPFGQKVEWDAEVTKDQEGHLIGWHSLEGSDIQNAGSVRFERADRGCRMTVTLRYDPPAGAAGVAIAKLLGEEPGVQLSDDLERFKRYVETGDIGGSMDEGSEGSEDEMESEGGREAA